MTKYHLTLEKKVYPKGRKNYLDFKSTIEHEIDEATYEKILKVLNESKEKK